MEKIYEFDTSKSNTDEGDSGELFYSRARLSSAFESTKKWTSEVTLILCAYNRMEKTKECIESIFKYTNDVDYDIILIDNGSTDGTLEYFKSLDFPKKRIIHITKNLNSAFSDCCIDFRWISNFCVFLQNDLILTKNWLKNLLTVAKSDSKIGFVNPLSSNASNLQMHNLEFSDYEDMQKKAENFNNSDPSKWQERLRLVILGSLIRKEALYAIGWPCHDIGFIHDFGDDDITFRIRRAGYKTVLAGDTWIHHNHVYSQNSDRDINEFNRSIELGRNSFKNKFLGIDSWDDVNNYVFPFLEDKIVAPSNKENVKILGIDTKCGTPILDIKNMLRKFNIYEPELYAYTTDAKYFIDLKTFCNGDVFCDRIDYLNNYFSKENFDYIIFDKNLNEYDNLEFVLKTVFFLLKNNGVMFVPLKNVHDLTILLKILGYENNIAYNATPITLEQFSNISNKIGIKNIESIFTINWEITQNTKKFIIDLLDVYRSSEYSAKQLLNKLLVNKIWLKLTK